LIFFPSSPTPNKEEEGGSGGGGGGGGGRWRKYYSVTLRSIAKHDDIK